MRVKRRNFEHRVQRMRLRASSERPPARPEPPVRSRCAAPVGKIPASQPLVGGDTRRRSNRRPLGREISVRKAGGFNFQLAALDVSTDGCRVELVERVDVNERVVVRLPALEPMGAEVAWVDGYRAGLRFQRPLHTAVFDQLIDRCTSCAA